MPKKTVKKTVKSNNEIYFDNENLKLILICFLFGVFGVHKFMQGKKGQGICFILLDLTVFGILVSFIWAFCNLISFTFQKNNKIGNMIVGTVCLCGGLFGWPTYFDNAKTVIIKESVTTMNENVSFEENLLCELRRYDIPNLSYFVYVKANSDAADIIIGDSDRKIKLPVKIYGEKLKVYEGFMDWSVPDIKITDSSNPMDKITLRIQGSDIKISGKLESDTDFNTYYCTIIK
ncbi:MAG: TM2 domain-containing protein [Alphaproteobacteria bacterium]|nr:TM2 domain-containing protein [Alphaproteobacteria bacterium]